jgi:hypothetical protein
MCASPSPRARSMCCHSSPERCSRCLAPRLCFRVYLRLRVPYTLCTGMVEGIWLCSRGPGRRTVFRCRARHHPPHSTSCRQVAGHWPGSYSGAAAIIKFEPSTCVGSDSDSDSVSESVAGRGPWAVRRSPGGPTRRVCRSLSVSESLDRDSVAGGLRVRLAGRP